MWLVFEELKPAQGVRCDFFSAQWQSPPFQFLSCRSGCPEGWDRAGCVPLSVHFFLLLVLEPLLQRRGMLYRKWGSWANRGPVRYLHMCLWLHSLSPRSRLFLCCHCPRSSARLWHGVGRARALTWLTLEIVALWLQELKWLCCHQKPGLLLWRCLSKHQQWLQPPYPDHTPGSWAASAFLDRVFSQDLAFLDPVSRCCVEWVGPRCSLSLDWGVLKVPASRADLSLPCLVASQHPLTPHK